jgi:hypothetical protein
MKNTTLQIREDSEAQTQSPNGRLEFDAYFILSVKIIGFITLIARFAMMVSSLIRP